MNDLIDMNEARRQRDAIREENARKQRKPIDDLREGEKAAAEQPPGLEFKNRAEAEASSRELRILNEQYAVVLNYGGVVAVKCMVYNEAYKRDVVDFITFENFKSRYNNKDAPPLIMGKRILKLGEWWLTHTHRKEYETITYEPDKPPGEYFVSDKFKMMLDDKDEDKFKARCNLWEGFAVTPEEGNWQLTKQHIFNVLCNKNKTKYKYVLRWLAWSIQKPGEQAEVALVFKGKKGAGKGTILQAMVKIFGRHGMVISNRDHLTGKFNEHLSTCSFLFADEAYNPGDKEAEGVLKNIITEPHLATEPKFQKLKITKNCLHIVMATNNNWVINATEDERRYFINDVSNTWAKNVAPDKARTMYFNNLFKELYDTDPDTKIQSLTGIKAMLYDLLKMNLTGWHPRDSVPETEELKRQIAMSAPRMQSAVEDFLAGGVLPGKFEDGVYKTKAIALLDFLKEQDETYKTLTAKSLIRYLEDLGIKNARGRVGRYFIFPKLSETRALWKSEVNKHFDYNTNEEWQTRDRGF